MNNLNGRYWSILLIVVLFLAVLVEVSAAPLRNKLIGKVFTGSPEEKKAMRLEQYWDEINFCLKNLGKKFDIADDELRRKLNGRSLISYELVAEKYDWYGDKAKEAEYYYKDWLEFNKTKKKELAEIMFLLKMLLAYGKKLDYLLRPWRTMKSYMNMLLVNMEKDWSSKKS